MAVLAQWDGYEIDDDRSRLDRVAIHQFLIGTYWATGIRREAVDRSLDRSDCYGMYGPDGRQVGFARVVGDAVRFAWLCDVFVLPSHRGRGLGRWIVETVLAELDAIGVSRIVLGTADAHGLYRDLGFAGLAEPERMMERRRSEPVWRDPALIPVG